MTCDEFQGRLSAYMDGELPRWKRWKVENHLQKCAECTCLMRELEEVDLCLEVGLAVNPAPEYLTHAVMHRLPAMPPAWRRPAVLTWSTGLAVASMQAAALFGAYWWGYSKANDTGAPVDRTGVFSAPTPRFSERHLDSRDAGVVGLPHRPAAPAPGGVQSGVWSKPIGISADPATLARLQEEPLKAKRQNTLSPGSIGVNGPRMQWEGAR
jgi:anti-sigma factor RsiW